MESGQRGVIMAMRGGREFQQRIVGMGLRVGFEIEVLHHQDSTGEGGGVVVRSADTRLVIGQGMAQKVLVKQR